MYSQIVSFLVNRFPVRVSRDKPESQTSHHQWAVFRIRCRSGFGLNEVIGIAAGIIIAVVIVIPGLQVFARNVLSQLTSWWNGMAADIFQN